MEPVEINAGAWYLLPLRPDEWAADTCYSWSVCEPTTGEPLAEVMYDPRSAVLTSHAQPGHEDAATAASESVRRFTESAIPSGSGITDQSTPTHQCPQPHAQEC